MRLLLVLMIVVFIHACGTQYAYDVIQHSQRTQCQKLPPSEYDECIARNQESYGKYRQKRKEATEEK